jgi:hypothetical protein
MRDARSNRKELADQATTGLRPFVIGGIQRPLWRAKDNACSTLTLFFSFVCVQVVLL